MATASYYREQARVFSLWAGAAIDEMVAQRLHDRAAEYLRLADQIEQSQVAGGEPSPQERLGGQEDQARPQIQPARDD